MSPFLFWCRACQSKRSLSLSLSFSLSQPVHTTLSLSLSHSFSLSPCLSLFHILTSPDWSLFLPGFSCCPPPPSSSTDRSLLHGGPTHHFLCAPSLLSHHLPLSLSLPHPPLPLSLSHAFTFHTLRHSDSHTYAAQQPLSSRAVCTCPQYRRYVKEYNNSFYCSQRFYWGIFNCRIHRGTSNNGIILFFQFSTLSLSPSKVRIRYKMPQFPRSKCFLFKIFKLLYNRKINIIKISFDKLIKRLIGY